jgi:hypothetical protein
VRVAALLQWQVLELHVRVAALLQWQVFKLHARVAALLQCSGRFSNSNSKSNSKSNSNSNSNNKAICTGCPITHGIIKTRWGVGAQTTDHLQKWPTHQWRALFILYSLHA